MKRKITVAVAAIVCSCSLLAQDAGDGSKMIKVGDKMISASKLQKTIRKVQMKKTGGTIREKGSAKGTFVVLNAQKLVPSAALSQAMETVDRWMLVQTSVKEMPGVGISNIKEAIRKSGGVLGVAIVEDASLPGFMVAPEDGWAIVNVKKLGKDNPKPEVLEARLRKETLRAFAFVSGGAYQAKGCSLMRDVKSVADIDGLQERFGLDTVSHVRSSAPFYGLVPWYQTTYLKACEEGWAPAPTNEYQKAIWDKVHAMPTASLKIKPETKKVVQ